MVNTSTNICKTGEFKDAYFFHSVCECTSDDHAQCIVVELDEDGYGMSCTIHKDLYWADWAGQHEILPVRVWRRICHIARYLFTGYARVSGDHIIQKEEHIRDYANAILGAVDELKRRRTEYLSTMSKTAGNDSGGGTSPNPKDIQGQGND